MISLCLSLQTLPTPCSSAAAEYDFQAIEGGQNNRLANVYNNLLYYYYCAGSSRSILINFRAEAFYRRSDMDLTIAYLLGNVPTFIFNLLKRLPTRSLKKMRNYMPVVTAVAQDVVAKQTELYAHGKEGSKDLMSVLGIEFTILSVSLCSHSVSSPGQSIRKPQDQTIRRGSDFTINVGFSFSRQHTIVLKALLEHFSLRDMKPRLLH